VTIKLPRRIIYYNLTYIKHIDIDATSAYQQVLILIIVFRCVQHCAITNNFFFCGAATQRGSWPPHSWGFWITQNDAPQSVGLLWTSDQLAVETSIWQHTTLTRDKHPCPSSFLRFLDHTQLRTTVGRTPLDEWSARRRDLYLTTYNTHNRQTSMPLLILEVSRSHTTTHHSR
jgi:hypothetical protein